VAGRGGGDEEPQAGGSGGTVSGALSTFGFSLQDEIATTRADTFKKANPQVQVKVTEGGFDEQQFLSAVASGAPPDLVHRRPRRHPAPGRVHLLAQIDMGQYRPAAVQQVRVMMIGNKAVRDAGLSPADSTPATCPSWPAWLGS
jgi:multiple sugar transport system substrate-binding protein